MKRATRKAAEEKSKQAARQRRYHPMYHEVEEHPYGLNPIVGAWIAADELIVNDAEENVFELSRAVRRRRTRNGGSGRRAGQ